MLRKKMNGDAKSVLGDVAAALRADREGKAAA